MAGARRFAPTALLRADRALHAWLGVRRFPPDDTIRNLFKRFRQGLGVQFDEPLGAWPRARVPKQAGGSRLDWDSTGFERYGEQEGVKRGDNLRKPGRAWHPRCGRGGAKRASFGTAGCVAGTLGPTGWWTF